MTTCLDLPLLIVFVQTARLPGSEPRGLLREPLWPDADPVPGPGLGQLARDGQHAVSVQRQDHQRAGGVRAVSPDRVGRLGGAGAGGPRQG